MTKWIGWTPCRPAPPQPPWWWWRSSTAACVQVSGRRRGCRCAVAAVVAVLVQRLQRLLCRDIQPAQVSPPTGVAS